MKNKLKLYFDKLSVFHEGYCSGAECEYEIEDNSKTIILDVRDVLDVIEISPELLEKYEDEIPVTYELRMKYMYSEERQQNYKGGLSGFCDKPLTNDERINFVLENWVCNENVYLLTRIEILE